MHAWIKTLLMGLLVIQAVLVGSPGKTLAAQPTDLFTFSNVVADGSIYLTGSHGLHAIDLSTGAERWRVATPTMAKSHPTAADGIIYFISDPDPPTNWSAVVHAVDATSGQELWTFEPDGILPTDVRGLTGPVIVSEGKVYVFESRQVFVLDAQVGLVHGEPIDVAMLPFGGGMVAAHEDLVLLATSMRYTEVVCVDLPTGAEQWTAPVWADRVVGPYAADDTALYLVDAENTLMALDWTTGEQRWKVPATSMARIDFVRLEDGALTVGRSDVIEGVDPVDGSTRWQVPASSGHVDDATARDGTLFIATDAPMIEAIDVENGQQRWSMPTETTVTMLAFDANGNLIVVLSRGVAATNGASGSDLILVDPVTGAPIWNMELLP